MTRKNPVQHRRAHVHIVYQPAACGLPIFQQVLPKLLKVRVQARLHGFFQDVVVLHHFDHFTLFEHRIELRANALFDNRALRT